MNPGKRRAKSSRAQLRPSNPIDIRQGRLDRQRFRLARLALIGLAALLTAAVVHGSGPPFPYRLGQRPSRELRVNVPEFQRKNLIKTNTARQAEADKVPPFMINDPAPIKELQQSLEDLVDAIAKAPGPADLPEGLAEAWKLDASTFDDLKLA